MTRLYREIATERRAVLVQFASRCGRNPARYTMKWLDTGELFYRDGNQVNYDFEHVAEESKVEVGSG